VHQGGLNGHRSVFPGEAPAPETGSINCMAGSGTANAVLCELSDAGELCGRSKEQVHLVIDVQGYFSPNGRLTYQPLEPVRILDTRDDDDSLYVNRLAAGQTIGVPIQGLRGMPNNVWAVATNLTAVGATTPGFLAAHPCGDGKPKTSSLNFSPGGAIGTHATSSIGADNALCLYASARTHAIIDIVGVWTLTDGAKPPQMAERTNPGGSNDGMNQAPDEGNIWNPRGPGTSDAPPVTRTPARTSTEAGSGCSSAGQRPGDPAQLWPLGLMLVLGLRRRREGTS